VEKYEELVEILLEIREMVDDALNVVVPPPPNTLAKPPQEGRSEEPAVKAVPKGHQTYRAKVQKAILRQRPE